MPSPLGFPGEFGELARTELLRGRGAARPTQPATGPSFADQLRDYVGEVNRDQVEADALSAGFAKGEHDDIDGTMLSIQQADISFRLMSNIRKKLIETYREMMRMGG